MHIRSMTLMKLMRLMKMEIKWRGKENEVQFL